jgi:hypothetical protein
MKEYCLFDIRKKSSKSKKKLKKLKKMNLANIRNIYILISSVPSKSVSLSLGGGQPKI